LIKEAIDFHEVEIRFLVRKGSYNAKTGKELRENVEAGIGGNDMGNIEAEDVEVKVDGK